MATDNSPEKNFVEKCSDLLDKFYNLPRKYYVLLVFLFPLLSPKRFSFLWKEHFINVFLKDFGVGIDNKHLDYVLITIYILVFITAIVLFLYKKIKHNYIFSLFHQLVLGGIAFVYLSYRFNFFFENHFWLRKFTISYLTSVAYSDITLLALITPTICTVGYVRNMIEWFNTTDIKLIVEIKSYFKKQVASIVEWFKTTNINRLIVNIKSYLKKQVGNILAWFKTTNTYQLVGKIKSYFKKQVSESAPQEIQGFIHDSPTLEIKNKSTLAKTIVEKLLQTKSEDTAFSLGISGEWGTGKTSFLMLLEDKLKEQANQKNIVIIKFNPWNSTSPQAIVSDFFDTFRSELGKYSAEIKHSLNDYSQKLVNTDGDIFSILKFIGNLFGEDKSIMQEYEKINEILRKINRQIFIFIDDLDRLDKNEVIEVIRLIRNSANFYNVFFIVAYDKGYVEEAIEQLSTHNKSFFLEKIFQLELHLPAYEYHHILTNLYNKLVETISFLNDNKKVEHFKEVETFIKKYEGLNQIIQNYRDVKRFVNSFSVVYNEYLAKETYFPDFFHIELLRFKFPLVYELLKKENTRNHIFVIGKRSVNSLQDCYSLAYSDEEKMNSFIKLYLSDMKLSHSSIKSVMFLIHKLFTQDSQYAFNRELQLKYVSHFNTYFAYRTFDYIISETEFQNAIKDIDTFKTHIDKWNKNDMIGEFIRQCKGKKKLNVFGASPIILSDENKKTLIKGIFYFGQINPKNFSYNYYDLITLFSFTDKNDMEIFARQIFEEAVYPYWFESNFLEDLNLNKMPKDEFVIKEEERCSFLLNYLRKIAEESNSYSNPEYPLYLLNQTFNKNKINNQYSKEAKDIMIDFIGTKDLAGALQSFIEASVPPLVSDTKYSIRLHFLSIFDTIENFENFLQPFREDKNHPNNKLVEEFWAFYQCSKNDDGTFKYIEYDKFEILKP